MQIAINIQNNFFDRIVYGSICDEKIANLEQFAAEMFSHRLWTEFLFGVLTI